MEYNEIINQVSEYYVPRGFSYRVDSNAVIDTIYRYYDGAMTIKFCKDYANVIFIITMDGCYVNEETSDANIKFFLNLRSLPILDSINIPQMIESRIEEIGSKKMKSHYKSMIRNEKLKQIGI